MLSTLAITLLAASLMSASEFGRFAVLLALAQVVAVPLSSLQAPVLRTVANADDPAGLYRGTLALVGRHASLQLMLGVSVVASVSAVADIPARQATSVLLLGVLLGAMQSAQAARRGLGDFLFGQAPFELFRPLLASCFLLTAMVLVDRTANTAFFAVTAATLLSAICLLAPLSLRQEQSRPLGLRPATFAWFTLATVGTSLIGRIEVIIVGLMLSSQQAGDLALALRFGQLGTFGISLAGFRFARDLSAEFAGADSAAAQRTVNKVTAVGVAIGAPAALVMLLAPGLLLSAFGPVTPERTTATMIVGLALLINVALGPTMMVMSMTGLERQAAYGQLAAVGVAVGVSLGLGGGAVAGALGYTCAIALWNAVFAMQLSRRFNLTTSVFGLFTALRGRQPSTAEASPS